MLGGRGSPSHGRGNEPGQRDGIGTTASEETTLGSTGVPIVPGGTSAFQEGGEDPGQPGDAKVSIVIKPDLVDCQSRNFSENIYFLIVVHFFLFTRFKPTVWNAENVLPNLRPGGKGLKPQDEAS